MSNEFGESLSGICLYQPVPWNMIPDLGLYMDQVVTLIGRVYEPLYGAEAGAFLSPAMVNNYVKARLIPRPAGKKYGREQIALLVMIMALKQVSSMEDIRRMLYRDPGETTEALYTAFNERFSRCLRGIQTRESIDSSDLSSALDFAIVAAAFHFRCAAALKSETPENI